MILWQHAKIMSFCDGFGKSNTGHITRKYKQLKDHEIDWKMSAERIMSENGRPGKCAYCGRNTNVAESFMIPITRGGPDGKDNQVLACGLCRFGKGDKRLYEWYGLQKAETIPIATEAKYLILIHDLHTKMGTIEENRMTRLCPNCDMEHLCPEKQTLSPYCLEGCFLKK
jgi:hypothetical protein